MVADFEIVIGNPQYNILFIIIPIIFILHFYFLYNVKRRGLKFGNFSAMKRVYANTIISKNFTTLFFILLIISLLITSLLDISLWYQGEVSNSDYYILLDSGASMNARDLSPDRYTIAKRVSSDLINNIKNSNIGFISFSGTILQNELLTKDKSILLNAIQDSKIENSGTDIGLAIVSASQGFSNSNYSKTIILLSDGQETVGGSLQSAITKAKEKHIKIMTFGIGTKEGGNFLNVIDNIGIITKLDEESLMKISNQTDSIYFNIKQDYNITHILNKINEEKTLGYIEFKLKNTLTLVVLVLLLMYWLLDNTRFRIFP